MVLIEQIILENCRLCHAKPGSYELHSDKKIVKDIFGCFKIKVNDKFMNSLPRLVCEECRATINSFSLFKQRVRKVDQCLRKILKNADVKDIVEEHLQCTKCPAEFNTEELFQKHLSSHYIHTKLVNENIKTDIACVVCKQSFQTLDEYGSHQCKVTLNISKDTYIKEENITYNDSFNPHRGCDLDNTKPLQSQKGIKHVCNYINCGKELSSAKTLKTHQLKHQERRSFLCVTCGKGFYTKNSLTCHEKTHLEVKEYACKLCNKEYSVRSNLRAHEKKYHEGVRFYCSKCTKAFISKCSLERHEKIHTGIKDHKCETCSSAFYTKKELLKHQRYHEGLRLHKCGQCFKAFYESHHLTIHLRRHNGERPYVCKFPNCGKSFVESQKLKRHHNAKHAQM